MQFIRIIKSIMKINLLHELQYSRNLRVELVSVALDIIFTLVTLEIMLHNASGIGSWNKEEVLVLMGVYRINSGYLGLFILPSLSSLSKKILYGGFDYILLIPFDAQVSSSISEFKVWKIVDIFMGSVFILIVCVGYAISINVVNVLLFMGIGIVGSTIIACFYSIIASLSFWFMDSAYLLIIFPQCLEWVGKWPVSIFPKGFKFIFSFVIPVGIAITVPTEVFLNRCNYSMVFFCICFSIMLIVIARFVWKMGIKKYSGASS